MAVIVRSGAPQGEGNVVRRIFADFDADIDIMADEGLRRLVGARVTLEQQAGRFGHRLLTGYVAAVFGSILTDMLSGYRVFSRRTVWFFAAHRDTACDTCGVRSAA